MCRPIHLSSYPHILIFLISRECLYRDVLCTFRACPVLLLSLPTSSCLLILCSLSLFRNRSVQVFTATSPLVLSRFQFTFFRPPCMIPLLFSFSQLVLFSSTSQSISSYVSVIIASGVFSSSFFPTLCTLDVIKKRRDNLLKGSQHSHRAAKKEESSANKEEKEDKNQIVVLLLGRKQDESGIIVNRQQISCRDHS